MCEQVVVLSDMRAEGLDAHTLYIPPLVAVGAAHHALINEGLRMKASLITESGQCWYCDPLTFTLHFL